MVASSPWTSIELSGSSLEGAKCVAGESDNNRLVFLITVLVINVECAQLVTDACHRQTIKLSLSPKQAVVTHSRRICRQTIPS